jgi:hypothetical protein
MLNGLLDGMTHNYGASKNPLFWVRFSLICTVYSEELGVGYFMLGCENRLAHITGFSMVKTIAI